MLLPQTQDASWIAKIAGVKFDLDFINKRYDGGYVDQKTVSMDTASLAGSGGAYNIVCYTPQANGVLLTGGASAQNRITDLGLFVDRASHNYALWCRDLTNAVWATTNVTATKNQVGNDTTSVAAGTSTASSITATAANGAILQAITKAIQNFIFSAYVKRLVGTGNLFMTVDGGATWTDITSQVSTTKYTWIQIPVQNLANPSCGFKIATNADSIAVDFCQCEDAPLTNALATTPMITTSTTATRGNETAYFTSGSGLAHGNAGQAIVSSVLSTGGPWWMLMSFNGDCTNNAGQGPCTIATDLTSPSDIQGGGGSTFGYNQTNKTSNTGNNGRGNWNKIAVRTTNAGRQFCLNGGSLSANNTGAANVPSFNVGGTHFNLGNNGSGTTNHPLNGSIGRVTFGVGEILEGQMIEYTSANSNYGTY